MEKIRINNDVEFYYNVYRNGVPESFIGASEISVKLVNEAYTEEIPITYSITGNVLTCNVLAENLTKCGVCRLFLSYTKADTFTTDAVPFQLVGLREDATVEVGEPIIVSGDIGVNKDGSSAYEVWESYPGNEGKTIEQYFEWLRENPTKIDLDGLNSNIDKLHFKPDTLVQLTNIGDVRYSTESKTLEVKVSDTVSIQLGQEMQTRVKNDESIQINNGQMVYINSAVGANPLAKIASTSNADIAQRTFGMATENIPANGFGAITTEGLVRDINTSAFPEGAMLWLGTNGNVTNIEPTAPTSKISVGMVLRSNASNGIVYVKIRAIARNQKLSDVYAPTLTGGDVLRWNNTTLRFEAFNITTALGSKVDTSRTITAGNGLTGGGDLTANRTINLSPADDSLTVTADNVKVNTNNTLTSTSTTQPLSANQGKVLNEKVVQVETDLNEIGTSVINKLSVFDYCNESDLIRDQINLTPNGFFNYKTLEFIVNSNFSSIRIDNVKAGSIYQFSGDIAYSLTAAVIFIDQENNIIDYLYGDNTSAVIHFDTGLIITPINCSSVIFQAYTINSNCYLYRYNVPKVLTSDNVVKNIWETVNPNNDMKSTQIIVESGFFYNGNTLLKTANAAFSCGVADVEYGDKVSYNGFVRYSLLWAIIFADENDNIIQRIGNNTVLGETINTGIIAAPLNAKKVYFGAYGNSFDAYIYKNAAIINEVSINDYIPDVSIKTKYINAYHYLFGGTTQEDIVNSGFDSSAFDSSTANSFLIHSKYFKSYRRKIEWRIQLTSSSVVLIGTGGSTSSISVASRQTQVQIDVPSSLLKIYTSEGVIYSTIPLAPIVFGETYIVRLEQYDYVQKITVLNEKTLSEVAYFAETATPQNSVTGKLLGYPFIKLVSGYVKIIAYDVFLMKNPHIVFVGDSNTECGYRQNTYASIFIENELKGDGCIIAQGGATIDSMWLSWVSEIQFMKPKFLSLLGGTNGTISQAQIDSWYNKCAENGIIFILNRVPVSKNPATYPWEDKNSIIRNSKIMGANFDYATALNNNPADGADNALFGDDVHPNAEGHAKMYIRFVNDVQII